MVVWATIIVLLALTITNSISPPILLALIVILVIAVLNTGRPSARISEKEIERRILETKVRAQINADIKKRKWRFLTKTVCDVWRVVKKGWSDIDNRQ